MIVVFTNWVENKREEELLLSDPNLRRKRRRERRQGRKGSEALLEEANKGNHRCAGTACVVHNAWVSTTRLRNTTR